MSAAQAECLFCRIVAGQIPAKVVHESENVLAFRDINPQAPTHVLVIPKEHHPHAAALAAARPEVTAELVAAAGAIAEQEGISEAGYRLLFNTGEQAGQTVFHAHLHVLGGEWLGGLVGGELR
ncbi:histidine triad nucleotide-binding protein [Allokutzneria albata]|uniref:Histidine triad (HIT) family protein n=1 Tax=Allokutzneria albata TaxID=211114 RepID=A0A1H0C8S9_ALLAB|nr:histidine triad nucleotide-binding protein [Allokutzneria albata]SDN54233.1 histidine triad (HIT) family protein [Allokutzneria albata]